MSKYYNLKYRCRICLEIYESKEDAQKCCAPSLASVLFSPSGDVAGIDNVQLIYECGECGIRHTSLKDVKECCQAAK